MKRKVEYTPIYAELTAKEARERTSKKIPTNVSNEIQYVMGLIDDAIDNGEFQCICYLSISNRCIEILKQKGYEIVKWSDSVTGFTSYEIKF